MAAATVLIALSNVLSAGEPAAGEREARARQVAALLADLDSDQYVVRRRAARRLEELVARPEWGELLAAEFQRARMRTDLSFEVRWHLEQWSRRLPKTRDLPPQEVAPGELDRLIAQLEANSYALRLGATERLRRLADHPQAAGPLLLRLKQRRHDSALSVDMGRQLEAIRERAKGTWLLGDPAAWTPPPVSDQQLRSWIEDLARPAPDNLQDNSWPPHRAAQEEIMDLMACDAEVPRVKAALEARLAAGAGPAAQARLRELADLARPAMVAEIWQEGRQTAEQHLVINVPQQAPNAPRPSHFDRIDDRVAHCVSGSTLSPGNYPVGVAFPYPHPFGPTVVFHLVNLPTPRRQMAYAHYAKTDEAQRLNALGRRTLDRFLSEKRPLNDAELAMLAHFDAKDVSRFAGAYFNLVEDQQELPQDFRPAGGTIFIGEEVELKPRVLSSRNGMLAAQLARSGTKEAIPGLLQAIGRGRFLPPAAGQAPYRLEWLAALAIARRDPWPEADAWLAGLLPRTDALVTNRARGPELGATAAGILLRRHGQPAGRFGLEPVAEPRLADFGLEGYRFISPEAPQQIRAWFSARKTARLARP